MNKVIASSVEPNSLSAAIDTEAILNRCMGKRSFALLLLDEFRATAPQQERELTDSVASGDCIAVAEAAHALKGAAAIVAAEPLRMLALEVETAATNGDLEQVASLLDAMRYELARCLQQIPEIRDSE